MSIAGRVEILPDADALAARVADVIAGQIAACTGTFRLALCGGATPRDAYRLLGRRTGLSWTCTEIFFGDERFVGPDDADSNNRMVRETLLAGGRVQPRKYLPMTTDGAPEDAARLYEETLRQQYGASTLSPHAPLFDLTLLGLGEDGHTASLLPGQPVLQERASWVAAVPRGRPEARLTLTYPALESSRMIIFIVSGAAKAETLRRVRAGDASLPAGALKPRGELVWLIDRAASGG